MPDFITCRYIECYEFSNKLIRENHQFLGVNARILYEKKGIFSNLSDSGISIWFSFEYSGLIMI